MKHLKRMAIGLSLAALFLWPFFVWWNNFAMAEAVAAYWAIFVLALLGLYLVGGIVDARMNRKGRDAR